MAEQPKSHLTWFDCYRQINLQMHFTLNKALWILSSIAKHWNRFKRGLLSLWLIKKNNCINEHLNMGLRWIIYRQHVMDTNKNFSLDQNFPIDGRSLKWRMLVMIACLALESTDKPCCTRKPAEVVAQISHPYHVYCCFFQSSKTFFPGAQAYCLIQCTQLFFSIRK